MDIRNTVGTTSLAIRLFVDMWSLSLYFQPQTPLTLIFNTSTSLMPHIMKALMDRITEEHPLSNWRAIEEDPWTTRFKSSDYEIEIFYHGETDQTSDQEEWEVSLFDVQNGNFELLAGEDVDDIEAVMQQAAQYASRPDQYGSNIGEDG